MSIIGLHAFYLSLALNNSRMTGKTQINAYCQIVDRLHGCGLQFWLEWARLRFRGPRRAGSVLSLADLWRD